MDPTNQSHPILQIESWQLCCIAVKFSLVVSFICVYINTHIHMYIYRYRYTCKYMHSILTLVVSYTYTYTNMSIYTHGLLINKNEYV